MKLKFSKKLSIVSAAVIAAGLISFMVYSIVLNSSKEGSSPSPDKVAEEPNSPSTPDEDSQHNPIKNPEDIATIANPTKGSSEGEAINGGGIIGNGQWIYFSSIYMNSPTGIFRSRPNGETLIKNIYQASVYVRGIMNNRLYATYDGGTIISLDMDGTDILTLREHSSNPTAYIMDIYCYKSRIYFTEHLPDFSGLYSMNESGEDVQELFTESGVGLRIISIEDSTIYYRYNSDITNIGTYDLKTKTHGKTFTLRESWINFMQKQENYLYYCQYQNTDNFYDYHITIKRFNMLTEQEEVLVSYLDEAQNISSELIIIDNKLYYYKDRGIYEYSIEEKKVQLIEDFSGEDYSYFLISLNKVQNSIYAVISYSFQSIGSDYAKMLIIKPQEDYNKTYVYLSKRS